MHASKDEFPNLGALGVYASEIKGDGNCLFKALSDQLYGDQSQHHVIRTKVIEHMRENGGYYKQFVDAQFGGEPRRYSKRKNPGSLSRPATTPAPSASDIDRAFEKHLKKMAKGGTWGDHLEISAFSKAYKIDVKIYQRDYEYVVSSDEGTGKQMVYVAYHTWEHYSSIRNLEGPHTGPPNVQVRALSEEEEMKQKEKLAQTPLVLPWMMNNVQKCLPYLVDKPIIKKTLVDCKGSVDDAVSKLLDMEERGSVSSTQASSGMEREPDSDDEVYSGPSKKQNLDKFEQAANKSRGLNGLHLSQESFGSEISEQSAPSDVVSVEGGQENDDPVLETTSSRASSSEASTKPRIRITINGRGSSRSPNRKGSPPNGANRKVDGHTQQKQAGPQRRRGPSPAQRKQMKQAQKAAREERNSTEVNSVTADASTKRNTIRLYQKYNINVYNHKSQPPVIENGFRTLSI